MKCIACGSTALIKGTLNAQYGVTFQPDDVAYLKKMFMVGARKTHAYACIHCSNVQMTVEFTDADRAHYQQFEGEQPDVLRRLSDKSD